MQFKGDIDNDGRITSMDASSLFQYKSGALALTDAELARADCDNDGAVALADALKIFKHISGESLIDEVIE